ncbi:MAG: hypothetical protein JKY18_14060 [Flavobacteriales bacterium]|nr:hypothetical protein [Flavobacteriales bacterium]
MSRIYHRLIAIVLIFIFSDSSAADVDSIAVPSNVDTSRIKIFSAHELNTPYQNILHYDFEVNGFQQYRATNNLLRTFNPNHYLSGNSNPRTSSALADLGTIGSPARSMIYQVSIRPGVDFGFHSYDHLKFNPEQTLYYNLKSPLTDIYYSVGAKEEQFFSVLHTQNVNKLVNTGFIYQRGGTLGSYARQVSNRVNFKGFTSINSKNQRYHLNAQVIWNELENDQSGGITEDTLFEDSISITRLDLPVKLTTAVSAENQQVYGLNQRYDFGNSYEVQLNDSVAETKFEGKFRLYHAALYDKGHIRYSDLGPDTGFYGNILLDSFRTDNHVSWSIFTNTLGIVTLDHSPMKRNQLNFGIAGIHEYIIYNRLEEETITYNGILKGFLSNSTHARFHWKVGGDYILQGINASDYRWELKVKYGNKKNTQYLDYAVSVQQRAPAMIHSYYEGNHYTWKNNFSKQHNATALLQYTFIAHNARIGVRGDIIGRYMYYDEDGISRQDTNEVAVYSGFIAKDFNWKHFSFKNRLQYQVVSDSATLRLPKFISSHSAYYHNHLFKKALYMQIGIDLFFNTSYYAETYVPSTHQFNRQSSKKIGNYPYLDLFVNFKINQAKFFVKLAHINQGFLSNTYYLVPHYPQNDRAIIAGISWRFYD